jgi:ribosomal RNA-processing protein 17
MSPATGQSDDEEEWIGIQGSSSTKEQEQEYEDEEVLATVTVVEDFDIDTFIHGPTPTEPITITSVSTSKPDPVMPKTRLTSAKKKIREKKIRYETKDARKVERTKQRVRRREKAELAGGKASRKARLKR